MKFVIRQLVVEDLQSGSGFFETLSNLSGDSKEYSHWPLSQKRRVWQTAKKQGSYFFVAVSKEKSSYNQIVSIAKLLIEPKFYYQGKPAAHLEDVATRKGFEGQGLSLALIKVAKQKAKTKGCYKMILSCKEKLIPFYSKSGFKKSSVCMRIDFKK